MEYGCIAEKLGHSFSKEIHKALFGYGYEMIELSAGELDVFMREKRFLGINVTIPYKEAVIPYLDEISDEAGKIGAVNTVVNQNGRLKGYNTDFYGMKSLIEREGISLENKKVLILGSGGTSKTALAVAESMNASEIYRVSREKKEGCITYSDAYGSHCDADVIINTTPVGMYPLICRSPIDISRFERLSGVVDAVYNPLRTKLVCDAKKACIKAAGGLFMLVSQAAAAGELFTGKKVSEKAVEKVFSGLIKSKRNIVLTGMPGCGKTTVGRLLAKETGLGFIDTDEEIVKREKTSIPEIFSKYGESGFRDIEKKVIFESASRLGVVISTGGGAILDPENVDALRENGVICFIDRPIEYIAATSDRPLSKTREDLEKRYAERYSIYCETSDFRIEAGNDAHENMSEIKKVLYDENYCC